MSVRVPGTVVVEAARAELLGALYAWERWVRDRQAEDARDAKIGAVDIHTGRIVNADPDHWPTHVPLFENKWESEDDDPIVHILPEAWGIHPDGRSIQGTMEEVNEFMKAPSPKWRYRMLSV